MTMGYLEGKLTGLGWEGCIRQKIFAPLGMSHSDLSVTEIEKTDDHALPYELKKEVVTRSEEHTSELQSRSDLVCRLLLEKKTAQDASIVTIRHRMINADIKFNLTIPLQQLNGLETLVIIMVANKYAYLQITRRRFLNEWEAFKKVISRRNIRRRITIPLTLSNLKLLRRITRTENILHRNFTRRYFFIKNRVPSNFTISPSTSSFK